MEELHRSGVDMLSGNMRCLGLGICMFAGNYIIVIRNSFWPSQRYALFPVECIQTMVNLAQF